MEQRTYFFYVFAIFIRYLVVAGLFFGLFNCVLNYKLVQVRIQKLFPKKRDYYREIGYSLLTSFIFAGYIFVLLQTPLLQYTQIYTDSSLYGMFYFILSILLSIVVHDTYFYWTHRLMHHPKLFRRFHLVHHKSNNPSAWAAYSFHPLEAILEGGIIAVIVFILPIHPFALLLFTFFSLSFNIYGHLGYELIPEKFVNSSIGKWINTSTSHNLHHKHFNDNYGLYFRFWDVLMETTYVKSKENRKQ